MFGDLLQISFVTCPVYAIFACLKSGNLFAINNDLIPFFIDYLFLYNF